MVIGVNHLLDCFESSTKHDIEDLLRLQRTKTSPTDKDDTPSIAPSHLIIDVDTALERLYGGYHPDWLAGGEWSHLCSYLLSLLKSCQDLSLCLIFCFDGTLYRYGHSQWYYEQTQQRKKVNQIFKHLKQGKTGSPRRHAWLAPTAFQLCLRMILRELNSPHLLMHQTWGYGPCQHQQQVKRLALHYRTSLLGIVSLDMEFFFATLVDEQPILLNNFSSKHFKLSLKGKLSLVEIRLEQLRDRLSLDNESFALLLTLLGNHILGDSDLLQFHTDLLRDHEHSTKRASLTSNGTTSPSTHDSSSSDLQTSQCSPETTTLDSSDDHQPTSPVDPSSQKHHSCANSTFDQLVSRLIDFIRDQQKFDNALDPPRMANLIFKHIVDADARNVKTQLLIESFDYYSKAIIQSQSSTTSFPPSQVPVNESDDLADFKQCSGVNIEVVRTALKLHKQGLMMPWILQCLTQREITFPVTIEPEMCNTIPNVYEFFRPIRKYLYSLLFGRHTIVREQVYNSEHGSYLTEVRCERLAGDDTIEQLWFGTNPEADRPKRLKTFLRALAYCDLPAFYSISHEYLILSCILRFIYMEMLRHSSTIVHDYEVMAFLSQAVLLIELQPKPLMNAGATNFPHSYEHGQTSHYETRPIQLAHLFMRGLETVVFANEVCGVPIHPKHACPMYFFNGKLFHQKYLQAQYYQQNPDLMMMLCDGNTRCAQIGSQLLDTILDRAHYTPVQVSQQNQCAPVHYEQQRVAKHSSRSVPTQALLANSTRPPARAVNTQPRTPVATPRQQQPPPAIRHPGPLRNGATKKNGIATPFNAKSHPTSSKLRPQTPTHMNTPRQPYPAAMDQWNGSTAGIVPTNPSIMQAPYQYASGMHTMPHPNQINHNFISPLEEQFLRLQMHPTIMMPYPYATAMINTSPFIATGPAFYQPSPPPIHHFQGHLATPQHASYPQMVPGLPPHAPFAAQRTANFATLNTTHANVFQDTHPRYSPTAMQPQPMSAPLFQQRMIDSQKHQQTPLALSRQIHRMPAGEFSSYDTHPLTPTNGSIPSIPIPMAPRHYPSMAVEHRQRSHAR